MKKYIPLSVIGLIAVLFLAPEFASAQVSGSYGSTFTAFEPTSTGTTSSPIKKCYGGTSGVVGSDNLCFKGISRSPKFLGATTPVLFASVGLFVFDGAGHILITDSVSVNGTITRFETYTGTYTLNSNGTGSMTLHSGVSGVPVNYDFVVVNNGTKLLIVGTDEGVSVSGFLIKQ